MNGSIIMENLNEMFDNIYEKDIQSKMKRKSLEDTYNKSPEPVFFSERKERPVALSEEEKQKVRFETERKPILFPKFKNLSVVGKVEFSSKIPTNCTSRVVRPHKYADFKSKIKTNCTSTNIVTGKYESGEIEAKD